MSGRGLCCVGGLWLAVLLMFTILPLHKGQGVVQVVVTGVNIHEGAGPAQVCVTIDDLGGVNITSATISTSDLGSAEAGVDYTALSSVSLGFSPSSMPGDMECIPISIADDLEPEVTERFLATVTVIESDGDIETEQEIIDIIDNDVIIFVPVAANVSEGVAGGTVEVCAELFSVPDTATTTAINATLTTSESSPASAVADLDYTNSSINISFPEGSTGGDTRCINVSITDDMALEGDETFTVTLAVTAGNATLANTMTTVTITSDDVSISVPASVRISEGMAGGMVQVCARISGGSADIGTTTAINATLATSESSPVSAMNGIDYSSASMDISFPEGSIHGDTRCIDVFITDDMALEGDETFTVTLAISSGDIILENAMTIITINDNEVTIFVPAQVMVSEGVARGTAQVCAEISGGSPYTTTTSAINATLVASEESPASAVAATDFNIVSTNISFAEGSLDGDTLCIVVPITDDMALNENINFTVSLIVTAAGDAMVENAITTVTIVNDDAVTVSIPSMVSVGEEDGMVQVCATLSAVEDTERDFAITLATNDGTAMSDSDYASVSSDEIFPSGSTDGDTACVNITILDDDILEGDHTFTVTLTTLDPDVMLGSNEATITIIDNEVVTVSIPATVSIGEGDGMVEVCANATFPSGGSQRNVTVTLTTYDATTMAGSDYTNVSTDEVFVPSSDTNAMQCVSITIEDDEALEGDETFIVILTTFEPIVMLEMNETTITIMDNDGFLNLTITPSKPPSVLLGDYISLNCSPIAPTSEDISYTWTHLNTSTVLGETSNILTFPRISLEQLGTYRCTVSSTSGGAEITINSARPLIEAGNSPAIISRDSRCPSTGDDALVDVLQLLSAQFGLHPLGLTMSYSAESCDQVADANPDSPSGMYWIYDPDRNPVQVQCQF